MISSYFNLDEYHGLARTEYVLDASTVYQSTLTALSTGVGHGAATVASDLTTPGGRITLATTNGSDTIEVALPPRLGNVGGSLEAWAVEVFGLYNEGARPNFRAGVYRDSGPKVEMSWDGFGFHLISNDGATAEKKATARKGGFFTMDRVDLGMLVDYTKGAAYGHVGGSLVSIPTGAATQGIWQAKVRSSPVSTAPATSPGFRQARLTLYWGVPGDTTRKTY